MLGETYRHLMVNFFDALLDLRQMEARHFHPDEAWPQVEHVLRHLHDDHPGQEEAGFLAVLIATNDSTEKIF